MFVTPLRLEAERPGYWVLLFPLVWQDEEARYEVPAGFVTDLASIPRALRWLLQQNGGSRKASVLHDWAYQTHVLSRSAADTLFRKALAAEGVGGVGRFLYWSGVRVGGWVAYRNYR